MILVLKSWFHVEDMISYERQIWKVSVAKLYKIIISDLTTQKKNLMNELKLYHRIVNFSVPIQLLIISMLKKLYPELWPLTKRNINYLSYERQIWKVSVAKQKNIMVSDIFTVNTITVLH
jgi:hypothetical protein